MPMDDSAAAANRPEAQCQGPDIVTQRAAMIAPLAVLPGQDALPNGRVYFALQQDD